VFFARPALFDSPQNAHPMSPRSSTSNEHAQRRARLPLTAWWLVVFDDVFNRGVSCMSANRSLIATRLPRGSSMDLQRRQRQFFFAICVLLIDIA